MGDLERPEALVRWGSLQMGSISSLRVESVDTGDLNPSTQPRLVIFSGGTAFNTVAHELLRFTSRVTHVLPVSDDGGSTAEIIRFLGGPAIGDIRSRCLRLSDSSTPESRAVSGLLGHRLHKDDPQQAKREFYEVIEGEHTLWEGVGEAYKHTIRSFLVHFHSNILRDANIAERFNFCNGSIGNFFFKGAQMFFRSMEAAIFLYSRVSGIPNDSVVLPCIRTNDRVVLGAQLCNMQVIRGQSNISHPAAPEAHTVVNKDEEMPLDSPIRRVFYMSSEGVHLLHEIFPSVNPAVIRQIEHADGIIYGMGSLYTSICPSLVLKGVGQAIAAMQGPKILILNGSYDRETSNMTASDFVHAITDALNRRDLESTTVPTSAVPIGNQLPSDFKASQPLNNPPSAYVTCLLVPKGGEIPYDPFQLKADFGIRFVLPVETARDRKGRALFVTQRLVEAIETAWSLLTVT